MMGFRFKFAASEVFKLFDAKKPRKFIITSSCQFSRELKNEYHSQSMENDSRPTDELFQLNR